MQADCSMYLPLTSIVNIFFYHWISLRKLVAGFQVHEAMLVKEQLLGFDLSNIHKISLISGTCDKLKRTTHYSCQILMISGSL